MGSLGRRQNLTALEICFSLILPTGDEKTILTKAEAIFSFFNFHWRFLPILSEEK